MLKPTRILTFTNNSTTSSSTNDGLIDIMGVVDDLVSRLRAYFHSSHSEDNCPKSISAEKELFKKPNSSECEKENRPLPKPRNERTVGCVKKVCTACGSGGKLMECNADDCTVTLHRICSKEGIWRAGKYFCSQHHTPSTLKPEACKEDGEPLIDVVSASPCSVIACPSFRKRPILHEEDEIDLEPCDELAFETRHAKYEAVERKTRLLRPSVISSLTRQPCKKAKQMRPRSHSK